MKGKFSKRLVTAMLLFTMVFTNAIPVEAETEATLGNAITSGEEIYVGEGYDVLFSVNNQWDDAFDGNITITNTSEHVIDNWVVEFNFEHEITTIWNAKIDNYSNGKYVIKNDNWNQDINPGESICFGFQATHQGEIVSPDSYKLLGCYQSVVSDVYTVDYVVDSAWGMQANASIKITNHSAEVIEDWQLSFQMNAKINDIWNGCIVKSTDGEHIIKNAGYNSNINPGESVSFGFQITASEGQTVIAENYNLKEMTASKEYAIINDSDEEVGTLYFKDLQSSDEILYDGAGIFYTKNQILITAKDNVSFEQVQDIIWEDGAKIVGYIELTNDYQIEYNHTLSLEQLLCKVEEYKRNELFEYVSFNTVLSKGTEYITTNDAEYRDDTWDETNAEGKNQNMKVSKVFSAWEYICDLYNYSSVTDMKNNMNSVRLGVMDGMFDFSHPDLRDVKGKVWNNPTTVPANENHGNHVAGILGAEFNNEIGISSIAVNKQLYAYSMHGEIDSNKVQFNSAIFSEDDAPTTIMEYKYALALMIGHNVKIINISLNTGVLQGCAATLGNINALNYINASADIFSRFLQKLLNTGHDFLLCIAAGNHHYSRNEMYAYDTNHIYGIAIYNKSVHGPAGMVRLACDAKYSNILSAIETPEIKNRIMVIGNISNEINSSSGLYPLHTYSDRGERMDVAAPGTDVFSCGDGDSYVSMTGTSQASPHVASLAGLIHEINPALSGEQIKNIIVDNADGNIHNETKKYVNALKAVEEAVATTGYTPPVASPSGIILGQITDINGDAISNGKVTAYKYNSSDGNLGGEEVSGILTLGGQENCYYTSVETDVNGEFEMVLTPGKYYLNISAEGYKALIVFDVNVASEETQYIEKILLIDNNSHVSSMGIAQGYIKDALNANMISGAKVIFREGWNNRYGDASSWWVSPNMATSNTSGYYSAELSYGNYTAEISKDGYIVGYANIVVSDVSKIVQQNVVLTPVLPEDEYRIVLQWGSTPYDLDSHLTGPTENGSRFHVYYGNKQYKESGEVVAKLDVDDVTSYGPETITMTLKPDLDGVYRYSVHDYTNRYLESSKTLSLSGAKVMLYRGNALLLTCNVPINEKGNLWTVFEIDDNIVTQINTISYNSTIVDIP